MDSITQESRDTAGAASAKVEPLYRRAGDRLRLPRRNGEAATAAIDAAASFAPPLWVLPLFMLVVSVSWFMLLRSFRVLNSAKYTTINEIEADLPLQPFLRERVHYKRLGRFRASTWELVVPALCAFVAILGLAAPFL